MSIHGIGYGGYPLTGRYRVQRDIGDTWATFRETEKYGGSWERVDYIGRSQTAKMQLALARNSLNRMGPWVMSQGRGSRYWTSQQEND